MSATAPRPRPRAATCFSGSGGAAGSAGPPGRSRQSSTAWPPTPTPRARCSMLRPSHRRVGATTAGPPVSVQSSVTCSPSRVQVTETSPVARDSAPYLAALVASSCRRWRRPRDLSMEQYRSWRTGLRAFETLDNTFRPRKLHCPRLGWNSAAQARVGQIRGGNSWVRFKARATTTQPAASARRRRTSSRPMLSNKNAKEAEEALDGPEGAELEKARIDTAKGAKPR